MSVVGDRPGFFAPEMLLAPSYDGAMADVWSLGAVMLEMLIGHSAFSNLWAPPYELMADLESFQAAIGEAVGRIKHGTTHSEPSLALSMLVNDLLEIDPEKRSPVEKLCETDYFDLYTSEKAGGKRKLLRLTFASLSDLPESLKRPVERRKRVSKPVEAPALPKIYTPKKEAPARTRGPALTDIPSQKSSQKRKPLEPLPVAKAAKPLPPGAPGPRPSW